ncbi:MAG TPA: glutamate 5-kinase [Lentisphaeria bacterium]|nr:MAG: glutamate 5-kinase [Lentisphaerae bacterium GWF2_38_69]HBM16544.1 glutamate 5-kinase [Lentisphaeria bacterium]
MTLSPRKKVISEKGKVVIKVGTRLLTDIEKISTLIEQIHKIRLKGYQVILVSSGAVGLGMKAMQLEKRPRELSKKQALASIGQGKLMSIYDAEARKHGFYVGQILLTMSGLRDREQHLNTLNCINTLLQMDVLPIINENDSVAVEELTFGDNDNLATLVGMMMRCQLTIILTSVDGLYEVNNGSFGKRFSVVEKITPEIKKMAMGTDDAQVSVGGMASKLKAAAMITEAGEYLWIANGKDASILEKIFNAEDVGTLFLPPPNKLMSSKKRWLSFFTKSQGQIRIDEGAEKAIINSGRSLLPSGILALKGSFRKGSAVDILNKSDKLIAKGLTNFSIEDLRKVIGLKLDEVDEVLGKHGYNEAIHRDNLVLCDRD